MIKLFQSSSLKLKYFTIISILSFSLASPSTASSLLCYIENGSLICDDDFNFKCDGTWCYGKNGPVLQDRVKVPISFGDEIVCPPKYLCYERNFELFGVRY